LDDLLDPKSLYAPPGPAALDADLTERIARLADQDLELQLEALRLFKATQVLRVAAADLVGDLPLAEVSNHLSAIAETVLRHALRLSLNQLTARYGEPRCVYDGVERAAGFGIVAYGKLGGLELSYGSDLDLVFLHDSRGETQQTTGERSIDNHLFFT